MNREYEIDEVKHHGELAARNSKEAVRSSNATRTELLARMSHFAHLLSNQQQKIDELERKYNLLITSRFNGGPTS
jgi:uncharacterized protein Yka (UPF0111/DUF47 family)